MNRLYGSERIRRLRGVTARMFRGFRYRNYRLYFMGQGLSFVGAWVQRIAMGWLIYRLTDSPFWVGFIGFCGLLPAFFFAPVAGVMADRWDRRRMLMITQVAAMVQALILFFLVASESIELWQLVVLALWLGVVSSFDNPTRQALVVDIVEDRADLGNIIALNSSMFNLSRLIGPPLAGLIILAAGEAVCFLLNAITYVIVLWAVASMRLATVQVRREARPLWEEIRTGMAYAHSVRTIRNILLLTGIFSFAGMPYLTLLPVVARDVLGGGPGVFGLLASAPGVGALVGAMMLASRVGIQGLNSLVSRSGFLFGLGLVAFALAPTVALAFPLLMIIGFAMIVRGAASHTLVQSIVDDSMRGRVTSLLTLAFMGTTPFGNLLAGWLSEHYGTSWTILGGGVACIVATVLFWRQLEVMEDEIRPFVAREAPAVRGGK